jgi:succinyl-CoA synthetase beta subunit
VDLYEYQARELYQRHAVPTTPSVVAATAAAAKQAAEALPALPVVIKAQVKVGGRGKAGGVKLAHSAVEAGQVAESILGMDIKGHTVRQVLVAHAAEIAAEYYLSILLDRSNRSYLVMASAQGGMDIETLAREQPEALVRWPIDPVVGLDKTVATKIVQAGGFPNEQVDQVAATLEKLWHLLRAEDATLVEVNPLALTTDGQLLALDGKITLDDNSAFRHSDHASFVDMVASDPLELTAQRQGLNYVKVDGQVGIIGNGAGLVMSTLDVVAQAGERYGGIKPANFLDIGGGASAAVMAQALALILSDQQVQSVLINVFGGITACDQVAQGIITALNQLADQATKPLVVRLDGNAVAAGRALLEQANHPLIHFASTMDQAAELAAQFAAESDPSVGQAEPQPNFANSNQPAQDEE